MKALMFASMFVTFAIWVAAFVLARYGIIPFWVAVLISIGAMFLGGYIALWILRNVLGWNRFSDLVVKAKSERLQTYVVQEDQRKADLLDQLPNRCHSLALQIVTGLSARPS